MIDQKALEAVAAIEHDQWAHWTSYMLDNLTPENARRWDWQCVTPYNELSETEKDSDRKWAVKSITAYEAALWQPIETLEYSDDPVIGESEKVLLVDDAGRVWVGSLMFAIGKGLLSWGWSNKPTHWMPLPEPPSDLETGENEDF